MPEPDKEIAAFLDEIARENGLDPLPPRPPDDPTRELQARIGTLETYRTALCVVVAGLLFFYWLKIEYARKLESAIRVVAEASASGDHGKLKVAIMDASEAIEEDDRERE